MNVEGVYYFLKALLDPAVFLVAVSTAGLALASCANQRAAKAGKALLAASVSALYLLSVAPVKNMLFYALEKDYLRGNAYETGGLDAVVVLAGGSQLKPYMSVPVPSHETPSRLLHGLQVFRSSGARYLVLSGKGGTSVSNAEVMAQVAIRMGVQASRLIVEGESRNTFEHAAALKGVLKDRSIRLGLVTSGYHMARSRRIFTMYFRDVVPLPSEYHYSSLSFSASSFMLASYNLNLSSVAIREIAGNLWYRIRYENTFIEPSI